ncbi:hypothetical protein Tco_1187658 [Tanacetum coccineum]
MLFIPAGFICQNISSNNLDPVFIAFLFLNISGGSSVEEDGQGYGSGSGFGYGSGGGDKGGGGGGGQSNGRDCVCEGVDY